MNENDSYTEKLVVQEECAMADTWGVVRKQGGSLPYLFMIYIFLPLEFKFNQGKDLPCFILYLWQQPKFQKHGRNTYWLNTEINHLSVYYTVYLPLTFLSISYVSVCYFVSNLEALLFCL